MRHINTVAVLAGPLVLLGYLTTSTLQWLMARRPQPRLPGDAFAHGVAAVMVATLASLTIQSLGPGSAISRVALMSAQALTAWQSVALWVGLAAVLGHMAPIWLRFEGGSGLPPAFALALAYAPTVFVATVAAFFGALAITRTPRDALPPALFAAITFAWLAWVLQWNGAWGVSTGPELSLMTTLVGTALFARWRKGDVLVPEPR